MKKKNQPLLIGKYTKGSRGGMGIFLIARDNIKKQKGNAGILLLLIALAVLLLYVGISVLSNMDNVIDRRNAAVHGADYFLFTTSSYTDKMEDILVNRPEVLYEEKEKAVYIPGMKYFLEGGQEEDADEIDFLFLEKDAARNLSTVKVIDEGREWKENSIILPYYMKAGLGYQTGRNIKLVYKGQIYSFVIYGFAEDVMFSTPTNVSAIKCFLSTEYYQKFSRQWQGEGMIYRAALKKGSDTEGFLMDIGQVYKKQIQDYARTIHWGMDYDELKFGTSITANILMAVLTVFAVMLILISLIIVHFNISNAIEMNTKNIGILEASGYTSRQLTAAAVLEFLIISIFGICIGMLGAKGAADTIGGILSASIGLRWVLGFDLLSAAESIAVIEVMVLSAVFISARKYKSITPLNALRSGIHSHNFRKNHIRLDRSGLPLNIAIGVKCIFHNKKKNLAVCLIIVLLTFFTNIAVSIYQNLATDQNKILQVTGFEVPDIGVTLEKGDVKSKGDTFKSVKDKIASLEGVKRAVGYSGEDMICRKGKKKVSLNCDFYEDTSHLRVDNVVEGRRPEYDNEIMLSTAMAQKLGAEVGDVVYLEINESSEDYLVVGLSQGINHLGQKAMITAEGAVRLSADLVPHIVYIYTEPSADVAAVIAKIHEILPGNGVSIIDGQKNVTSTLSSIMTLMKILCVVMLLLSLLVIALVLILLIKTQLIRNRKQFGIYKALGYTTGQLNVQMAMSYLPIVALGAVLGCVVAWFGTDSAFILCLSAFGIKKCVMDNGLVSMFGSVLGIAAWSELVIALCSIKIGKIVPCEMNQEI